jgi:hypothetical protein
MKAKDAAIEALKLKLEKLERALDQQKAPTNFDAAETFRHETTH